MDDSSQQSASTSINDLNPYCLAHILSFFPVVDRIRLQRVSKSWQEASEISFSQITKLECFYHLSQDSSPSSCVRCGSMTLQQLRKVLPLCGKSLKYFRYIGNDIIGDNNMSADKMFFKLLMLNCPNLQTLDIRQMKLTSKGLRFAAKHYNNFTELGIACTFVREHLNDALIQLLTSTKRLSALEVYCIYSDLPTCLEKAPAETLESLNIEFTLSNKSLAIIENVIKNCYKLCKLRLRYPTDGSLDPIFNGIRENGRQNNFKTLEIIGRGYNFIDASILSTFTKLESLYLDIEGNLNDCILNAIGNGCQSLTSLVLIGHPYFSHSHTSITDEGLVNFSNVQHLKLLGLINVTGTFFTNMPNLETVSITSCDNIARNGFTTLFECAKKLRLLKLRNMRANRDCVDAAPRNRGNKIHLTIHLTVYNREDECTYKEDYLTVKQTF